MLWLMHLSSDVVHLKVSLPSVRPWDSTVKAFNVMKSTKVFHSVLIHVLEEDLEFERKHLKSRGVEVDERAASELTQSNEKLVIEITPG